MFLNLTNRSVLFYLSSVKDTDQMRGTHNRQTACGTLGWKLKKRSYRNENAAV